MANGFASRLATLLFAASLALLTLWLCRHVWLLQPSAFQLAQQLGASFNWTPAAKRPELITLASHAKLQHRNGGYRIHGQLFNGQAVPLALPDIVFEQVDRDGQVIQHSRFSPQQWLGAQHPLLVHGQLPTQQLIDFSLNVLHWPDASWGYRIQLRDAY